MLQALTQGLLLPVQKIEVGDEFTGATVIEPVKGYVISHILGDTDSMWESNFHWLPGILSTDASCLSIVKVVSDYKETVPLKTLKCLQCLTLCNLYADQRFF